MARDLSPDEAFDQKVAELTSKHFVRRLGELISGNQDAVRGVDDALSHELCKPEVMGELIMLAVTDARQAGAKLNDLIEQVVRAEAECDAIREAEQMEKEREQQAGTARAELAVWDQAMERL